MKRMMKNVLLLFGMAAMVACSTRPPTLHPPAGPHFRSLSIKFSFHDAENRQSGRVHWRFDEKSSKFIFFTPLNQVGLELKVAGENAVLVNVSEKTFGKGGCGSRRDLCSAVGQRRTAEKNGQNRQQLQTLFDRFHVFPQRGSAWCATSSASGTQIRIAALISAIAP